MRTASISDVLTYPFIIHTSIDHLVNHHACSLCGTHVQDAEVPVSVGQHVGRFGGTVVQPGKCLVGVVGSSRNRGCGKVQQQEGGEEKGLIPCHDSVDTEPISVHSLSI